MIAPIAAPFARFAVRLTAKIVTGAVATYHGEEALPTHERPAIYFANHRSHGDFVLLWSVLPADLRERTRPVAGADYWQKPGLRSFIGESVFNAVLIEREAENRTIDPVEQMVEAVREGASLILFPEGTRNMSDELLLPFKTGLFHLAEALKHENLAADFIPVWIDNLNRVLPKGEFVPVPVLCKVHFGAPLAYEDHDKEVFLTKAREALLALSTDDRGIA